jgi:fumarate hydratase, class II
MMVVNYPTMDLNHTFKIGENRMPPNLTREIGILKKTAALVNRDLGKLPREKANLIIAAADEVIAGKLHEQFPPRIWQTESVTQTNVDANEGRSNRAIEMARHKKGRKKPIHPNDDVKMSQSSNDTFPTAMYVAAAIVLTENLAPALKELHALLETKSQELAQIVQTGRTHLQDATLTVDQEVSGRSSLIERDLGRIRLAIDGFYALAIGGTAVGTGLSTDPEFVQLA